MNTSLNQTIAAVALSIALSTGAVNWIGNDLKERGAEAADIIGGNSVSRTTESYIVSGADVERGY